MPRDKNTYSHPNPITVGRLRDELAGYPDDFEVTFSSLDFYRVKQRGDAGWISNSTRPCTATTWARCT